MFKAISEKDEYESIFDDDDDETTKHDLVNILEHKNFENFVSFTDFESSKKKFLIFQKLVKGLFFFPKISPI